MTLDSDFLKTVLSIKDLNELELFFEEVFTPNELSDVSLRWKLLKDLHRGITQRKIAEKYGISLCKITRGSKILKNKHSVVLNILDQERGKKEKGEIRDYKG